MRMLVIPSIVGVIFAAAGFIAIAIERRRQRREQSESK